MDDGPRDLMYPDLWAGSLERSLERRRRSRRGSIELGRLKGARELSNPEVLLDSLQHSRARREAVERSSGLPAPAARGLSIVGLIAAVVTPATGVIATVASAAPTTTGQGDTPAPVGSPAAGGTAQAAPSSADIAAVQKALGLPADGNFGPQTTRAVKAFQKAHHLQADGVVGPTTRAALGLAAGATVGKTGATATSKSTTARTARSAQSAATVNSAAGGVSPGTLAPPATGPGTPKTAAAKAPVAVKAPAAAPSAVKVPAAPAKPATTTAAPTSTTSASLAAAVRSLQRRLGVSVDGQFGAHTRSALKRFQKAHRLTADGIVGPATLRALGLRGATATSLGALLAKLPASAAAPAAATLTAAVINPAAPTPTATAASAATGGAAPTAPPVAPTAGPQAAAQIAAMEAAGDRIATLPYIWGGGHASFAAAGYDCSGSVSYVLHAAGLLSSPEDSTGLESYGAAGPGAEVTIYANASHAFMVIDGRRFDTIALSQTGTRWSPTVGSTAGYVVRHPVGL